MNAIWTPEEKMLVQARLGGSIIGDKETVGERLDEFVELTAADEIMVNALYSIMPARRSYEIVADIWKSESSATAVG
jgi:alkanesulfonate monooxygenase SsuD/methylene tetrahydromethanopterin reductase-like flavin-dependent oxidoreductase (luciferase family)